MHIKVRIAVLVLVTCLTSCIHQVDVTGKELVFVLHGFGRSRGAMIRMADKLTKAGYVVERIGYRSWSQNINEVVKEVESEINSYDTSQAKKVHFVGHSLGGLLCRSYLGKFRPANLGRVVVLGSPNKGTPVVDRHRGRWYFFLFGPAAESLGTKDSQFLASLKKPDYPLGVIAGVSRALFEEQSLKGQDDGLVEVESTKVDGMKDFLLVKSPHTRLRSHRQAIAQTIHFLKHGEFNQIRPTR